jgi:hypothetical protein
MMENSDRTVLLHLGEFFPCQSIQIKAMAQGSRNSVCLCQPKYRSVPTSGRRHEGKRRRRNDSFIESKILETQRRQYGHGRRE